MQALRRKWPGMSLVYQVRSSPISGRSGCRDRPGRSGRLRPGAGPSSVTLGMQLLLLYIFTACVSGSGPRPPHSCILVYCVWGCMKYICIFEFICAWSSFNCFYVCPYSSVYMHSHIHVRLHRPGLGYINSPLQLRQQRSDEGQGNNW